MKHIFFAFFILWGIIFYSCGNLNVDTEEEASGKYGVVWGVFLDGSTFYGVDRGNNRICYGDFGSLNCVGEYGSSTLQFKSPTYVFVSSGKIYISDTGNNRIVRMNDISGAGWIEFKQGKCSKALSSPLGIVVSGGYIYIADSGNDRIVKVDDGASAIGETSCNEYGTYGDGEGNFNKPSDIALDSAGKIYIVDQNNHRIVRIDDMTGANWVSYGEGGYGEGEFNKPHSIYIDSSDHIYVTDTYNNRLVTMDDINGTNFSTFGTYGTEKGEFFLPADLFIDETNGLVYVGDSYNHRFLKFKPDLSTWEVDK